MEDFPDQILHCLFTAYHQTGIALISLFRSLQNRILWLCKIKKYSTSIKEDRMLTPGFNRIPMPYHNIITARSRIKRNYGKTIA